MEVIICESDAEVGRVAAAAVAQTARQKQATGQDPVLGLATGSSPLAIYAELAQLVAAKELDLSTAYAFALDEYVGLPPGHEQSYAETIRRTVTEPLKLDPARVAVPDGTAADLAAAAAAYEQRIADAGGIDVQILGIGANGHIGFNEPGSSLSSRTRIKTLAPRTRADNTRFFDHPGQVPVHCLTQGLGTISESRRAVLVAQGAAKADAIAAMVEGPVSAHCPASVLQFHNAAVVIIDDAAASNLRLADYYRAAYADKPDWQRW